MKSIIQGEERFQVNATEFVLGPSKEDWYLMYSADGVNFTKYDQKVPAKESCIVNMAVFGMYYYCKGNNTNLTLEYEG